MKQGYPLWKYAKITIHAGNYNSILPESDTLVSIPIVEDGKTYVKSILAIKVNTDVWYKLLEGIKYKELPLESTEGNPVFTVMDLMKMMMEMEYNIFGYNEFEIIDEEVINSRSIGYLPSYITRVGISGGCIEYNYGYYDINTDEFIIISTERVCSTASELIYSIEAPPEGGGAGPIADDDECKRGFVGIKDFDENGHPILPCPNLELVDSNGYFYSAIDELNNYLDLNPYGMLPCDELEKIGPFGLMFQDVGSFKLPQLLKNRIDSINDLFPFGSNTPLSLYQQTLDNANGKVVNCDFYPLVIQSLPTGFTAKSLLEFFRLNMDTFSLPNCSFQPYSYNFLGSSFSDTSRSHSPYEESIGSIIHIDIPLNDGSVILGQYKNEISPFNSYENHNFIFTTLNSPSDWTHPVAGNREFGIYNTADQPNRYFFYIMGVDRINSGFDDNIFRQTIFNGGDSLWTNVQRNLINFINRNGCNASEGNPLNIKVRIDYNIVEEFLRKDIDLNTLKLRLGC